MTTGLRRIPLIIFQVNFNRLEAALVTFELLLFADGDVDPSSDAVLNEFECCDIASLLDLLLEIELVTELASPLPSCDDRMLFPT